VQGITDLITTPGLINVDFADVKSVMAGAGTALMGIGSARGEGRSVQAAQKAINSPLLEASMDGAHGVLLSIAGGSDLGLFEINEAASLVQEAAHEDANIIFGTVIDDSLGDEVRVTVIAAGFDSSPSVLPPSIDQRVRASADRTAGPSGRLGGAGGHNGHGGALDGGLANSGNGGFSSHPQRPEPQMPPQPQYATTPPPPSRGAAPAYQQQAPGRYPTQAPQHQGAPVGRGRQQLDLDDDDVDVPSFMKR